VRGPRARPPPAVEVLAPQQTAQGVGGVQQDPALKPPLTFEAKQAAEVSPLLKVTDKEAPALMIHCDKYELVPIEHSK
jgi:hypothetical protein